MEEKLKPSQQEIDWFAENQEGLDWKSLSDDLLLKYFFLGSYFREGRSFRLSNNKEWVPCSETIRQKMDIIPRILQIRILERQEKESERNRKSDRQLSFWALGISVAAFLMTAIFSILEYKGNERWQMEQTCLLSKISNLELSKKCEDVIKGIE